MTVSLSASPVFWPTDSPFRRKLESAIQSSLVDTNSSQNSSGECICVEMYNFCSFWWKVFSILQQSIHLLTMTCFEVWLYAIYIVMSHSSKFPWFFFCKSCSSFKRLTLNTKGTESLSPSGCNSLPILVSTGTPSPLVAGTFSTTQSKSDLHEIRMPPPSHFTFFLVCFSFGWIFHCVV